MAKYDSEMTLGDARSLYFDLFGFKNGGYDDAWVVVKVWRFPIVFPNTKGRLRAVKLHDLHHVLTEYDANWMGETEIGAWEVATGLRKHYQGWLLDLLAFAIGLVINPRGVYRAFMRGRQSSNLYDMEFTEEFLSNRVGEIRRQLRLDREPAPASRADKLSFALWATLSVGVYAATAALCLAPLVAFVGLVVWWMKG
ncbi:MAG TPA: hypothetical protein VGB73_09040 [Pyrinomonadaceae bacterium]|jgi:hypothetical protein